MLQQVLAQEYAHSGVKKDHPSTRETVLFSNNINNMRYCFNPGQASIYTACFKFVRFQDISSQVPLPFFFLLLSILVSLCVQSHLDLCDPGFGLVNEITWGTALKAHHGTSTRIPCMNHHIISISAKPIPYHPLYARRQFDMLIEHILEVNSSSHPQCQRLLLCRLQLAACQ